MEVAGVGLGVMFINMFVYGTFEGLNGAIDTLVSQSFGAGDYRGCNLVYNRATVINSILFLPISLILIFSKQILISLGQDEIAAATAQKFLILQIPGLFCFIHVDVVRRYLQAQGDFDTAVKGLVISTIFHVVIVTSFLMLTDFDPVTICASVGNFTFFINYVLLRFFSRNKLNEINHLPILEGAFTDWRVYLSLALPCAFIICFEWWMYEALTLLTGLIGVRELATIVIIFNTHNFVYDFSYGFSQATSSIIGRTLSEFGEYEAKRILIYILMIELALCTCMTIVYLCFPRQIIGIFSDEEEIIDMYYSSLYYIIVMFIFDSTQIVIGGIIRGIGEQGESSIVSFISYAIVTLPSACLFTFYMDMGLQGIILSYIFGVVTNTVLNAFVLANSEWGVMIEDIEDIDDLNYIKIEDV